MSTAIANVAARDQLRSLLDEQAALRRVATLIARGAQPVELFSAVSNEVARLFGSDEAAVGRFEPDGSAVVVVGASEGIRGVSVGARWALEPGWGRHDRQRQVAGASGCPASALSVRYEA